MSGLLPWNKYASEIVVAGGLKLKLGEQGGLAMVTEVATGTEWASGNNVLGQFVYRTHSENEFNDWGRRYVPSNKQHTIHTHQHTHQHATTP